MKIEITATINLPNLGGVTVYGDQITQWLAVQMGVSGAHIGSSNPLNNCTLQVVPDSLGWVVVKEHG